MKKNIIQISLALLTIIAILSFSHVVYLRMMADVNLTGLDGGQVLMYDSESSKWAGTYQEGAMCGANIVTKYNADTTNTTDFSSAILAAIAASESCIYLPKGRYVLDRANRLTIPANVELIMHPNAIIRITTGDTLYIKSEFRGGLKRYFNDENPLLRGVQFDNTTTPIIYAEWWGAKNDDTLPTQTRKAFQSVFNSTLLRGSVGGANAASIHVHSVGQYTIDSTVHCYATNVEFTGNLNSMAGTGGAFVGTRFKCTTMPAGTIDAPKWMFVFEADKFYNLGVSPTPGIQGASASVTLVMKNITLRGNSNPYGTIPFTDYISGVFSARTAFIVVEECTFVGLYDAFTNIFGIFTNIENNNFNSNFRDAYSSPRFTGSFTTTTWIENNEFAGSGRYHIFLDGSGGSAESSRIYSNDFEAKSTGNYYASRPTRFYLGIEAAVCLVGQNDLSFCNNRFEADAARHNAIIIGASAVKVRDNFFNTELGGYAPNRSSIATAYSSGLNAGATAFLATNKYLDVDTLRNGILASGISVSEFIADGNTTDVGMFLYCYGNSLNTGTTKSYIANQEAGVTEIPIVSGLPNFAGKTEMSNEGWTRINTYGQNSLTSNYKTSFATQEFSIYRDASRSHPYSSPVVMKVLAYNSYRKIIYYHSPPAGDTWANGDRIINSEPNSGEPSQWICTIGGTPGTWIGTDTIP